MKGGIQSELSAAEQQISELEVEYIETDQELEKKPPIEIRIKLMAKRAKNRIKVASLQFLIKELKAGQEAEKIQ